ATVGPKRIRLDASAESANLRDIVAPDIHLDAREVRCVMNLTNLHKWADSVKEAKYRAMLLFTAPNPRGYGLPIGIVFRRELFAAVVERVAAGFVREWMLQQAAVVGIARFD